MFPYQISFIGYSKSDFIENLIIKKLKKMSSHYNSIINCKVLLIRRHNHNTIMNQYQTEIIVSIAGNDTIVKSNEQSSFNQKSAYTSINQAFIKIESALGRHFERLKKRKKNKININKNSFFNNENTEATHIS